MKQIIKEYFTFNKRERNGVFLLMLVIFLELIYLNTSGYFISPEQTDFSAFEKALEELNRKNEEHEIVNHEKFMFDPNEISEEDWLKLGLSKKQSGTILRYLEKGGRFRKKEDLRKMYCIPLQQYLDLEPFLQIRKSVTPELKSKEKASNETLRQKKKIVELNLTDSAELTTVKGIGPFYAKQIIKYRTELGGFVSKEQLLEIWKFDREKYEKVEAMFSVDARLARKININTCTAEELKNPYLRWNVVNAIISYRKHHGPYKNVDEIRNTDLVNEETLRKIAAYLIVE
jgi:DNA uptake protein ComE-like DNA-binding protein